MKRLVLLLALASAVAQAKTVVMDCGTPKEPDIYRYTSDPTPKYEERFAGRWSDFCEARDYVLDDKHTVITCDYRDQFALKNARTKYVGKETGDWSKDLVTRILAEFNYTTTIDFVGLRKGFGKQSVTCTRLESD
jgi:hypothetical protein